MPLQETHLLRNFNKGYHVIGGQINVVTSIKLPRWFLWCSYCILERTYADDSSTKGLQLLSQEKLNELTLTSHRYGWSVAIHAIGDGAIEMV